MNKMLPLLGLLAIVTGCTTTEPTPQMTKPSPQIKDICKECYTTPISLTDPALDRSQKTYKKWGDRDLGIEDNSTNNSISCDSISELYLKENCAFIQK